MRFLMGARRGLVFLFMLVLVACGQEGGVGGDARIFPDARGTGHDAQTDAAVISLDGRTNDAAVDAAIATADARTIDAAVASGDARTIDAAIVTGDARTIDAAVASGDA